MTEQTVESYAATFDTNVLGTLLSMKHEMRVMLAQGSGSIVNPLRREAGDPVGRQCEKCSGPRSGGWQ